MPDQDRPRSHDEGELFHLFPAKRARREAACRQARPLPQWRVILHNDDVNEMSRVAETIHRLTPLNREAAFARMQEAHTTGASLLLITHRERAELYAEQLFDSRLTVSIEPVD